MFGLNAKLVVLSVCLQCCYLQPCNDDDGWFTMKQSCLKVYGDLQTFEGAKQKCENVSAQLMPFNTRTDYSVIYEKALEQRVRVWIGLKVERVSGEIVATSTDGTGVNISDPLVLDSFGEIPTLQEDSCMSLNRNIDGQMTFLFTRNLIDCNEMSGFVCQRPQDVCSVGWKIHRGICFKMFDGMHSWNLSSTLCQAKGAQLLKLSRPSDQRVFQKYIPEFDVLGVTSVWIGISDNMNDTGPLQWSDGSMILNFSYWAQTEPINTQGSQDCGYIDTSDKDGRWQTTTDCTQAKAFVCMIPANTPVKKVQMISEFGSCHPEWILFNGNCYMFSEESYPWRYAQKVCVEAEADLAIITDDNDQAFINGHIQPDANYWIGLSDVDQDGSWMWVDGSKATYTHLQFRGLYNGDCVGVVGSLRGSWLNYICERHFNFICQKPADINNQSTVETTVISDVHEDTTKVVSGKCGALWEERPNSDYCYQVHSEATSHQMAEFNCRQNNSTLVSIANSDEQNFLAGRLYWVNSESFWIGATDSLFEDGWTWSDGTPFAYLNWKPGKPDNIGSLKDCAAMLKGNSMWSDFDCSLEMSYICKKLGETVITNVSTTQASLSPGLNYGCPLGWMQFNDHCYLLISERENWAEANSKCRTNRAELTSINSEYENDFLGSRFSTDATSGWWTGLSNGRYYYTFEWSDDSTVQFTNWAVRHPVLSTGENCVVFIETKWHTADCDSQLPYVCKKRTGIVTETSTSPSQTGCPANTMAYDAFCYQFLDTRLNWTDAEGTCSNQSQGHLAAINDIHAHLFLASELGSRAAVSHYWIGLSDISMPGDYVWSTGEKLLYAVWSSRYTGNQQGMCVGIRTFGVAGQWDPLDCNNTRPFVCQFPRDGYTTTTTTVATTTQTPCLDGWQEFQGNCYRPFTSSNMRKSWSEARDICQSYGGDLVSISNQLVNDFVRTVFTSPQHRHVDRFWIGLSDLDKESAFKWSDGTVMSYAKWFSGEPNNYMGGEDCGEYYMGRSAWNDDSCYIPKYFLCSVPRGRQVSTLQPRTTAAALLCNEKDWFFKDGYCYYLSPTSGALAQKTWFAARRFCQENNADLASILSADMNTFLVEYANSKQLHKQSVWFGLHQINSDAFEWTDRSPYVYQNWRPGEPNNHLGSEKCGHMLTSDGEWNDDNCGREFYYFCKKLNGTKAINPTPTSASDATGGCPIGFSGLGNKCYAVRGLQNAQSSRTWSDAVSDCNAMSSRNKVFLASITSPEEQAFIMTLLENSKRNIYIGLNDLHTRRLFTWQSGEEVRVTYWAEGMPGSGMGTCVVIQVDEVNFGRWKEVSCKDRYGYACQTLKDPNYPVEEPVQGNCKTNYLQYRDSCYRPYTVPMQWSKAQKVCENDGGNLASISSVRELAKVHVLIYLKSGSNSAWIGMFFDKNSTLYKWVDGTPIALTKWDKGEPNMQFAGSCVSMVNGVWSDNACSQAKHFVCKITSDATSTTPAILPGEAGYCENPTWIPFREYCYYANPNDLVSWNDANLKCKQFRMDLLSLHSQEEQNFIMNLTKQIIYPKTNNGSSFGDSDITDKIPKNIHWTKHPANGKPWLGFRRDLTGGFQWSDNSQVNFFAWHAGEPNNADNGEDCVELLVNYGNWNDLPCAGYSRGYICKTKKIVPSTSTEAREAVTTIKTTTLSKTFAATTYSSLISSVLTAQPTTTASPSTQPTTTASPSTQPTTTASPSKPTTTASPSKPTTTASPSTQPTTTASPSTQPTTTASPSTQPTTTASPSTQPTTTASPITQPTTTASPSTQPTTTFSLSTQPEMIDAVQSSHSAPKPINGGEIAGIVIGIITAVVITGVVIYAVRRYLKNRNNPRLVDCMTINALYSPLEEHYF